MSNVSMDGGRIIKATVSAITLIHGCSFNLRALGTGKRNGRMQILTYSGVVTRSNTCHSGRDRMVGSTKKKSFIKVK